MLRIAVRLTEGCVISFCVFLPPGARFGPGSENHSRDQFGGFAYIYCLLSLKLVSGCDVVQLERFKF